MVKGVVGVIVMATCLTGCHERKGVSPPQPEHEVISFRTEKRSAGKKSASRVRRVGRHNIRRMIEQLKEGGETEQAVAQRQLLEFFDQAGTILQESADNPDSPVADRAKRALAVILDHTRPFVDALGHAIQCDGEPVEVWFEDDRVITGDLDICGSVTIPYIESDVHLVQGHFSHSQYGRAAFRFHSHDTNTKVSVPLVKKGTQAYGRALKGIVVGPDHQPVAGAMIHCREVRTPGRGLIASSSWTALTDQQGYFSLYLPNKNRKNERGDLIPPHSQYNIRVEPPSNVDLFPYGGMHTNTNAVTVTLPRAERFHRFVFEGPHGDVVQQSDAIEHVKITYSPGKDTGQIPLGRSYVRDGGKLLPGVYQARNHKQNIDYLPIQVGPNSPTQLVFRCPPTVTFHGTVVHGVTGQPMAGAFVMGWSSIARNNLARLTTDDWKRLHGLPIDPEIDAPALQRIRQMYGLEAIVRTDRQGRYELIQQPGGKFFGLMAFDQHYLPYKNRCHHIDVDRDHRAAVADLPLFPAAKLLVNPISRDTKLAVSPEWIIQYEGQPDWFSRFQAASGGQERGFEYVHWLELNRQQPIYVPSDLHLNIRFKTPYADQWSAEEISTPIYLSQGHVLTIGDVRFNAALRVAVRVQDSSGSPVEGAPVRRIYDNQATPGPWSVAHNTDAEGLAYFHLRQRSQGRFRVTDIPGRSAKAGHLVVSFEIGQSVASDAIYTITLTDRQIELLFGRQTAGK